MMTQTDVAAEREQAPPTLRLDLYREVHKGIRRALFALCEAAGALDPHDTAARHAFVARFAELDTMLTLHHDHEDGEPLQRLIADVAPEFVAELEVGHDRAMEGLAELRRAVIALADTDGDADTVYDRITSFVVEYLDHMDVEEHRVMPVLAARATFEELLAVQVGIRTAIAPADMVLFMHSMLPAMNPDERTNMLGGMKAGAPPEVFDVFWSTAADVLTADQFAVVAGRLQTVEVA